MADLVGHTGRVHHTVAALVRLGRDDREAVTPLDPPPTEELQAWFESGVDELAAALEAADPARPAWSWSGDHTAGFWQRRMAHETAVHRWDAQNAAGIAEPIAPRLAADGVDEMFTVMMPFDASNMTGAGEAVAFEATDEDVHWIVRITPNGLEAAPGTDSSPVATVRGTASDLDLLLWGRRPVSDLETTGDAALVERFVAALELT
jgi:uncharacterized protein (TIGR03083 family)